MNEKQAIRAARRLKAWCMQNQSCWDCFLYGTCIDAPKDWKLPETEIERAIREADEVMSKASDTDATEDPD